jgi:hypothetical protein
VALHLFSAPSIVWRFRTRFKQLSRAVLTGAIGIDTLLLSLLSVAFAVYSLLPPRAGWPPRLSAFAPWLVALGVVAVVGILWFLAWRALHQLPPDEFSRVSIGGLSASQILQLISYEIWKVARRFHSSPDLARLRKVVDGVVDFEAADDASLTPLVETIADRQADLERHLERLKRLAVQQQGAAQRITAMKHFAAEEFGTPPRRLCDHLFQFSPMMYLSRTAKLVGNWEEILANFHQLGSPGPLSRRLRALLEENRRIDAQIGRRIDYQLQILRFFDLLPYVHALASEHSTSGSLRNYARAISHVVRSAQKRYGETAITKGSRAYEEIGTKLQFLYFKQRVHPGFDLHHTCIRACELGRDKAPRRDKPLRDRIDSHLTVLEHLHRSRGRSAFPPTVGSGNALQVVNGLAKLAGDIDATIEECRKEIYGRFTAYYLAWARRHRSADRPFVLTHGYSKTVRDALKNLLGGIPGDAQRPRIFVMTSPESEAGRDGFDTRLMTYELRQSREIVSQDDVAFGDEKLFLSLLEPRAQILVVLGAECFDEALRVIHPRGMSLTPEDLTSRAGTHTLTTVVLAEEYKFRRNLLDVPTFYQHHLDRISLYDRGVVDAIISDREVRPPAAAPRRPEDTI